MLSFFFDLDQVEFYPSCYIVQLSNVELLSILKRHKTL